MKKQSPFSIVNYKLQLNRGYNRFTIANTYINNSNILLVVRNSTGIQIECGDYILISDMIINFNNSILYNIDPNVNCRLRINVLLDYSFYLNTINFNHIFQPGFTNLRITSPNSSFEINKLINLLERKYFILKFSKNKKLKNIFD